MSGHPIRSGIAWAGEKIAELAWSVGRDEKMAARRRRRWKLLQAGLGAGSTLLARRAAARVWSVLTGETPPARPR